MSEVLVFEDTFTGSGTLAAHTTDSGHTWEEWFEGDPAGPAFAELSGGGLYVPLRMPSELFNANAAINGLSGLGDSVQIEVEVDTTKGGYVTLFTQDLINGGSQSFDVEVEQDGDITVEAGFSGWLVSPRPSPGLHTVRIDIDNGTGSSKVYVDDVLQAELYIEPSPSIVNINYLLMQTAAATLGVPHVMLSAVRLFTFTPVPPEVPRFWTSNVGVTETP